MLFYIYLLVMQILEQPETQKVSVYKLELGYVLIHQPKVLMVFILEALWVCPYLRNFRLFGQ